MAIEKFRALTDEELKNEEAKASEQLFRIRFAKSLGKQEGVGKIKPLKLDIARIKTLARERRISATHSQEAAAAGKE
jgi:large subunit ribosomal protein L29